MENIENIKPQQQNLPFGVMENKEKEDIKWEIKVDDGNRDSSGEQGENRLVYDNGRCTIDEDEVPFEAFLFAVGPHRQFLKGEDKKVFEEILKIEKSKKELKK